MEHGRSFYRDDIVLFSLFALVGGCMLCIDLYEQ
jgi:hypothetical protein